MDKIHTQPFEIGGEPNVRIPD